ncbi:MAG: hypothetical protein AVDCRST_MAG04-1027, partial [uncultured Acetobacteraceae bacterium]
DALNEIAAARFDARRGARRHRLHAGRPGGAGGPRPGSRGRAGPRHGGPAARAGGTARALGGPRLL